jgi:hypothetical protein
VRTQAELNLASPAPLDSRDRGLVTADSHAKIDLAPILSTAEGAADATNTQVVHRATLRGPASSPIDRQLTAN